MTGSARPPTSNSYNCTRRRSAHRPRSGRDAAGACCWPWLGLDLPTVAKLTSLAAGAAILVLLVRHRHRRQGLVAALVAGGAIVVFLPTYFHITSGLETVAFAALVLRAVLVGLDALEGRPVRVWEPPLLVLAGMLRPDGVIAALPAFLAWLWVSRRDRRAWLWSAGAAVVGAGYFAWRWSFYGNPFPNTFYIKFGNVDAGEKWLETTVVVFAPLLVLTVLLLVFRQTRRAGLLLCATVVTTYLTYVVSGPTMDYTYRFAFHAFPVLCLGAGLAAGTFARAGSRVWLAAGSLASPARTCPRRDRTVAVGDAGAIPYYSGWRAVDYIGLNDEPIAHGESPTTRVESAHPTVIVVRSLNGRVPRTAYGMDVRAVTSGYELVANVRMRADYYKLVFVVPEYADAVRGPVRAAAAEAQRTYDPGHYEDTISRWLNRLRGDLPF